MGERGRKALLEGDVDEGCMTIGQGIGSIKDIPACQEVMDRTIAEAEEAMREAQVKF